MLPARCHLAALGPNCCENLESFQEEPGSPSKVKLTPHPLGICKVQKAEKVGRQSNLSRNHCTTCFLKPKIFGLIKKCTPCPVSRHLQLYNKRKMFRPTLYLGLKFKSRKANALRTGMKVCAFHRTFSIPFTHVKVGPMHFGFR